MTADPPSPLAQLFAEQKAAFAAERDRTLSARRADLTALLRAIDRREADLIAAVNADFGTRAAFETRLAEIGYVRRAIRHARTHLGTWARPRPRPVDPALWPARAEVRREPKGVVGIIAPWNYPVQLALGPLVEALSAGCRVMLKPSEATPQTARLLQDLLADAFPQAQVAVVLGGIETGEAFAALPFDHLFFTGSTAVGRLVARAAAGNLTPVTLELGGKSPAVIAPGFPVADAAAAIVWGKLFNAGQTCIAPDYVLAPRAMVEPLTAALLARAAALYPAPHANPDYTAILTARHRDRLAAIVADARLAGAQVLHPEGADPALCEAAGKWPFTILLGAPPGAVALTEEIFGPVLPIVPYDDLETALARIAAGPIPLALYLFDRNEARIRRSLAAAPSGGAVVNGALLHYAASALPFGGRGASGSGAGHGETGFLTFSHERAVLRLPPGWHPSRLVAPPYRNRQGWLARMIERT